MLGAEFHGVDALQVDDVPEIIHGGAQASVNYLVRDVYPDHIQMTPGAAVTGDMTITHDGVTAADGELVLQ